MTFPEEAPIIEQLIWDVWNTEHIAIHGVTRDDVEEAIRADTVALRKRTASSSSARAEDDCSPW
jgi:hypothetical protein